MFKKEFNINSRFKLNGKHYTENELISFCKNKSSENNEVYIFIMDLLSNKRTIKVQTSGSTGNPKTYSIKKSKMISSAKKTEKFFNLKQGDKALLCLPISFIAGKMMVVRALTIGLDLVVKKPCDDPLEKLNQNFDFAAMTVHQLNNSIKNINKIKCLIVGGSPVNESLKEKITYKTKGIYETYGMTETLSHVALKNLSNGEKEFSSLPGVEFSSRNGVLVINASYLSKRPIITNDIVELISDTRFVWIGRKDYVINSGGIKTNPEIIEKKLNPFYSSKFIICGIPHEKLGEQVVLVFENKIPSNYTLCFNKLGVYEKPKEVFCLKFFKYLNGKIERRYIQNEIIKMKNEKSN